MQHTYLRYECADAFGLITSSGAPQASSVLAFLETDDDDSRRRRNGIPTNPIVITTAGSYCIGYNLRSTLPTVRLGHRDCLSGGIGTGKALNSDEVICLDVCSVDSDGQSWKVATGWSDGTVRVFDVSREDTNSKGLCFSLTQNNNSNDEEFCMRKPLVLTGHTRKSPVLALGFDRHRHGARLASGGSDGSVVLWDVVAETGLFRLLGHRAGITNVLLVPPVGDSNTDDILITTSLDGLVKIWDLNGQYCRQTLACHKGEVWGAACSRLLQSANDDDEKVRWRLVTSDDQNRARVWSLQSGSNADSNSSPEKETSSDQADQESLPAAPKKVDQDEVCRFMGYLPTPPNTVITSERIAAIRFHPKARFVGVLPANSKDLIVYSIRSTQESLKKKQRRLKRQKTKLEKQQQQSSTDSGTGRKRGILDDDDEEEEGDDDENLASSDANDKMVEESVDPEVIKASDEFEYFGTVRASHKIRGFSFVPGKGSKARIACALTTNSLEVHELSGQQKAATKSGDKEIKIDLMGHPTAIRSIAFSSDDVYACTVSKNAVKIWNVAKRSCVQSYTPSSSSGKKTDTFYALAAAFLPGNAQVVVGTREGHLFILDVASGEVLYKEEKAHEGAIWSVDVQSASNQGPPTLLTGSADKSVKFWDIEENVDERGRRFPGLVQTRILHMKDDVVAVRYSHSLDPTKKMVFVSTLDCTIKVFFNDTLNFFLSLYGHHLPALALDASDDDTILATSGADKTIKIWGLDFGDTHRTLYGHDDAVTDLRFVRRTHNFFSASKDGTVRYWDGDRFEQILLLNGHRSEVNCLAVSRTGAFVLSGGMDRQVRVWERTQDIVFLDEERERHLEGLFDEVDNQGGKSTAGILESKAMNGESDEASPPEEHSEAAVRRSLQSMSSGDRIMEVLERADQESADMATFRRSHGPDAQRTPNPLLLGMDPALYVLWVLKTIQSADLEQSLLILPMNHMERLVYYLILLLRRGRGVELCSRAAIIMVKAHQNQLVANRSLIVPLRELRRLVALRLEEMRDGIGFNLAALRLINNIAEDHKQLHIPTQSADENIWKGLGLGSEVAAALEGKGNKKRR